ncbi:MAG: metal-dependent transcriptional regulator [Verrucomicrobia bacterium]|nr:metal-dependent transcriptional regulator [Verrucomicrobiota bacterium]
MKDVWKEYEANTLTHSAAHYLMTIRALLQERGYARVTDIAREMNITRGSCSISLKPLKKRGLVTEDENKFLQLSVEGARLAAIVERNDEVLEGFLTQVLGVSSEQAEVDACKIEHLLSLETSMRLAGFVEFVSSGKKPIREFLDAYRAHRPTCERDTAVCDICTTTCLQHAEGKTKTKAKTRRRSRAKS